ncbi:CoA ester lyase [Microbacterium sp. JB110]|nr:CoA ester lyase [Microbacterium sp. JB110]SJM43762.1 Citrate lyase beta chain [Frigoribacterium sp. JB110]
MIQKARTLEADAVILDLEDAVTPDQKGAAREHVAAELSRTRGGARWVRVNPGDSDEHRADVAMIVATAPDAIVLPKAEPASLAALDARLDAQGSSIPIVALVETCMGLLELGSLCRASPRLTGLQLGAEDLTAELAVARTRGGEEIRFARHQLAVAARAHGLMAIDTPQLDIADEVSLVADTRIARSCGMTGKACIHPSQLQIVAEAFRPGAHDIEWARDVVRAAADATERGVGAVALHGQMIDAPVLARARRILATLEAAPTPSDSV